MKTFTQEDAIPEIGTAEFTKWWESQYAPAESHNIEYVEGTPLDLNRIFWETD